MSCSWFATVMHTQLNAIPHEISVRLKSGDPEGQAANLLLSAYIPLFPPPPTKKIIISAPKREVAP
jgi:hypothetical protein